MTQNFQTMHRHLQIGIDQPPCKFTNGCFVTEQLQNVPKEIANIIRWRIIKCRYDLGKTIISPSNKWELHRQRASVKC